MLVLGETECCRAPTDRSSVSSSQAVRRNAAGGPRHRAPSLERNGRRLHACWGEAAEQAKVVECARSRLLQVRTVCSDGLGLSPCQTSLDWMRSVISIDDQTSSHSEPKFVGTYSLHILLSSSSGLELKCSRNLSEHTC